MAAGFGRQGMPRPNPDLWPFDLESGMRLASKVGNLPSKFGQRPLGFRIIRYFHYIQSVIHNARCPVARGFTYRICCKVNSHMHNLMCANVRQTGSIKHLHYRAGSSYRHETSNRFDEHVPWYVYTLLKYEAAHSVNTTKLLKLL